MNYFFLGIFAPALRATFKAIATACFLSRPEWVNSDIFEDIDFLLLPLRSGMKLPIECLICKTIFYVPKYRKSTAKCCSRKCLWHLTKSTREPKRLEKIKGKIAHNNEGYLMQCKYCQKEFHISPSRIGNKFFCSKKCYSSFFKKENKTKYKMISVNGIRCLEHRYLMEKKLNRKLMKYEHVHHINGNSLDNRIENLYLVNWSKHGKITNKEKKY